MLGNPLHVSHERRAFAPRRCAWCLRFWTGGEWIDGRRSNDDETLPASTHTICDDCVEDLRRKGLSI